MTEVGDDAGGLIRMKQNSREATARINNKKGSRVIERRPVLPIADADFLAELADVIWAPCETENVTIKMFQIRFKTIRRIMLRVHRNEEEVCTGGRDAALRITSDCGKNG